MIFKLSLILFIIPGAGLALLGALSNNRPQYNQYSSAAYRPSSYPVRPSYPPRYPTYAHSAYPVNAHPAHPVYAQPTYAASIYPQPHYATHYGGYGYGRQQAKTQDIPLPELNETEEIHDKLTSHENEEKPTNTKNKVPESEKNEEIMGQEHVDNANDGETEDLETPLLPTESQQQQIASDNNGLVLYPTLFQGPILLHAQPAYVNQYYEPAVVPPNPYQTQLIPTGLNDYQYTLWNYGPHQINVEQPYGRAEIVKEVEAQPIRQKRNSKDDQMEQNERDLSTPNSNITDTIKSTDISEAPGQNNEIQETIDLDNVKKEQNITQDQEETSSQLKEYTPPINLEERRTKKKKPSRGTFLAAGLLGAAAGYALTNTGINSYYNRPPQYYASYPSTSHYTSYPPTGYPPSNPVYINHYPSRPPVSPYYYPLFRSITMNNQDLNPSLDGKEINETRSPFIIISTQQKPSQRPSQFPYNQHFYYQQYHANNYGYAQPQQHNPNRFVYIYGQRFNQNQFLAPPKDLTKT